MDTAINCLYSVWYRKEGGHSLNFLVTTLICHYSAKREPSGPHSVWQVWHSWWQQDRAHRGHRGHIFGCAQPGLTACGSHPGFSTPRSLPKATAGWGENPQFPPRIHFYEMCEIKAIRCVMVTTCWNAGTTVKWGKMVFSSQKFGFPLFLLVCFIMPNFPLQGAVQRFHFLQRADSKFSFIQEKKNETKPGDTWTDAETCWSCLWRQEGFGESWQLFLTIFPSKQQMKGNCQSWTGWVLIQHFQRGQEVSRVCYWNVRQPQFSTGGEADPSLV